MFFLKIKKVISKMIRSIMALQSWMRWIKLILNPVIQILANSPKSLSRCGAPYMMEGGVGVWAYTSSGMIFQQRTSLRPPSLSEPSSPLWSGMGVDCWDLTEGAFRDSTHLLEMIFGMSNGGGGVTLCDKLAVVEETVELLLDDRLKLNLDRFGSFRLTSDPWPFLLSPLGVSDCLWISLA